LNLFIFHLLVSFLLPSPFKKGEKLIFDVSYGFLPLGILKMEIIGRDTLRGRDVYVLRMTAETRGMGALFTVADTIYSYITSDSMYTLKYEKKLKEGHFRDSLVINYFPDSGFALYSKGKKKEKLLKGAIDPLGLYYLIRRLDINSGDTITVPYHVDRRNRQVHIFVQGVKKCGYNGAKTKCYDLMPDLDGGIIKGGGQAEILISYDSLRLPIIFNSRLYFGTLKAKLIEYIPSSDAKLRE